MTRQCLEPLAAVVDGKDVLWTTSSIKLFPWVFGFPHQQSPRLYIVLYFSKKMWGSEETFLVVFLCLWILKPLVPRLLFTKLSPKVSLVKNILGDSSSCSFFLKNEEATSHPDSILARWHYGVWPFPLPFFSTFYFSLVYSVPFLPALHIIF